MKKTLLGLCLLSTSLFAADNFTLWTAQTFTGPFTDGVIATSGTINNTSGSNAIKVHIVYEDVQHTGQYSNV